MAMLTSACVLPVVAHGQDALVERGEYLMNGPVACGNCHNTRAEDMSFIPGMEFAGGFHIVEPPAFDVYAANITPDPETGIGTWTDQEIIAAIREGKDKEGEITFPPMPVPTYNNMSDDDVNALVAYLRTVEPVHNEVSESNWSMPQQPMPPAKGLPAPPQSDQIAYGSYIVNALAHCFECHSTAGPDGAPDFANAMGAGGFEIHLTPDLVVRTPNITPDPETGIGEWSDDDIKKAMTEGIRPDGGTLSPPMPFPFFKNMTADDLDAVVAYLRTIPPKQNKVERTDFQKEAFP
jgi:mono/diheme cytochrome c family protein